MRGAFAVVLLSLVGAAGCSDGAVSIEATQHGKRLDLVAGDDTTSSPADKLNLAIFNRHLSSAPRTALYRDVAGVVLVDPQSGAQRLEQWVLSQDGTEVRARNCPVKTTNGVDFDGCGAWGEPASLTDLGLTEVGPIRSFSTYLFTDASGNPVLAQVAFDMAGSDRVERTCPIVGQDVTWASCSSWLALEEPASALGVPQQVAFEDEVVVPYADKYGAAQFTQQLIMPAGDAAWARTCTTTEGQIPAVGGGCAFSAQMPIASIGIHFDAISGIGGYAYTDNGARIYAQTAIAADGVSAARRLCTITDQGVDFGHCLGWESVDLTLFSPHALPL
jgi:hypothetical protein